MRKIILSEMVSLDGFIAGPDDDLSWHLVDEEFNQYAIELLNSVDAILFGRVTYQLFENYWPAAALNPSTSKSDLEIANKINDMIKIVFSRTLQTVQWKNSILFKEVIPEEVQELKRQTGKDMVIYGSGSIVSALMQSGLIDDYRIFVNPVILGRGKPLFKDLKNRVNLRLLETKTFNNGNVLLRYQPEREGGSNG